MRRRAFIGGLVATPALAGPVPMGGPAGAVRSAPGPDGYGGVGPGLPPSAPVLDVNFTDGSALDPRISFLRGSTATYFDATGVMQTAAANVPRIDYGPNTGGVVNWIKNNAMIGAAAPNTGPYGWNTAITGTSNGLTFTIAQVGTESGIPFIDLTVTGTCTSPPTLWRINPYINFDSPALIGQTWTNSLYVRLISGSMGDASVQLIAGEINANSVITELIGPNVSVTTAPLNTQRASLTRTNTQADTVFFTPSFRINFPSAVAYSFTIRFGGMQAEISNSPSPLVVTSGAPGPIGATNWIPNSASLSNFGGNGATTTPAATIAPDGTLTAMQVTENTATGAHFISWSGNLLHGAVAYTFSAYLKAGTRTYVSLELRVGTNWVNGVATAMFDLVAGTVFSTSGSPIATSIVPVGNGWFRASVTGVTVSNAAQPNVLWSSLGNASAVTGYTGDGVSYAYIWGAQFEQSTAPSAFIPTQGSPVNVGAVPLGLLMEEQRVNSVRNPRCAGAIAGTPGTLPTYWTNAGSSTGLIWNVVQAGLEDGIYFVDLRVVGTATAGQTNLNFESGIAAVSSQSWTASVFMRLVAGSLTNVTSNSLSIVDNIGGNNFTVPLPTAGPLAMQRRSFTRLTNSTGVATLSCGLVLYLAAGPVDVTIRFGTPQLEQSTMPTSTILPPDAPAVATRFAEAILYPVLYNANALSMEAEYVQLYPSSTGNAVNVLAFDDGGALANFAVVGCSPQGSQARTAIANGVTSYGQQDPSLNLSYGSIAKVALSMDSTSRLMCADHGGVYFNAIAPTSLPAAVNITRLGSRTNAFGSSTVGLTCYHRRVRVWSRALSAADLVKITT